MPDAQIIDFSEIRATRGPDTDIRSRAQEQINPETRRYLREPDLEKLYPLGTIENPGLISARALLSEALVVLDEAVQLSQVDDIINADDCIQRVRALLPDLFLHGRSIGDGFRSMVLSTYHSIENADYLTLGQIGAVRDALRKLHEEPFIEFEVACQLQERYERAGLDPDSEVLTTLGDLIFPTHEGVR